MLWVDHLPGRFEVVEAGSCSVFAASIGVARLMASHLTFTSFEARQN